MPYSRDPEAFSQLFYDVLDFALESRKKIEIPTTEVGKTYARLLGFRNAWKARAEGAERAGNFALAAEHKKRVSALLRYQAIKQSDKLVLLHKDCLQEYRNTVVSASEERVSDPLLESAALHAQAQLGVASPPKEENQPIVQPDNIALRVFGIEKAKSVPKALDVAEPLTDEEKALLQKSGFYTE